jgi:hypothetical protein
MRALVRLPEPKILAVKKVEWLDKFLSGDKKRPDSTKYANPGILADLNAISLHKCYYCEAKLKGTPSEVDHHIEVSCNKLLAYTWDNLYLSCTSCNNKLANDVISVEDALDPFRNTQAEIDSHLTFEHEQIIAVRDSEKGLATIRKYKLSTLEQDYLRYQYIKLFNAVLIAIKDEQIQNGGRKVTEKEVELLNRFQQRDQPYSAMFKAILATANFADIQVQS